MASPDEVRERVTTIERRLAQLFTCHGLTPETKIIDGQDKHVRGPYTGAPTMMALNVKHDLELTTIVHTAITCAGRTAREDDFVDGATLPSPKGFELYVFVESMKARHGLSQHWGHICTGYDEARETLTTEGEGRQDTTNVILVAPPPTGTPPFVSLKLATGAKVDARFITALRAAILTDAPLECAR